MRNVDAFIKQQDDIYAQIKLYETLKLNKRQIDHQSVISIANALKTLASSVSSKEIAFQTTLRKHSVQKYRFEIKTKAHFSEMSLITAKLLDDFYQEHLSHTDERIFVKQFIQRHDTLKQQLTGKKAFNSTVVTPLKKVNMYQVAVVLSSDFTSKFIADELNVTEKYIAQYRLEEYKNVELKPLNTINLVNALQLNKFFRQHFD